MRNIILVLVLVSATVLLSCAPKETPAPPEITIDTNNLAETERSLRQKIATGGKDANTHIALAEVLVLKGNVSEGVIHFDLARQIDSLAGAKVLETRKRLAAQLARQGRAAFDQGQLEIASAALVNADLLDVTDPTTSILRGEIAQSQGHGQEAIIHFRKARERGTTKELDAHLRSALVSSARMAVESEDPDTALLYLREAQSIESSPELDYLIGTVAYSLAKGLEPPESQAHYQEASEAFERVRRADPEDQDAAYNLGAVLLAQGRYEEAVTLYYDLIERHPRDGELYQALSMAHGRMGESAMALAENAVGQALRAEEPVEDPLEWALRSARRFPGSGLETAWRDMGPPTEVYTFQGQGRKLTELWCYWSKKTLLVFRDGGRVGEPVSLENPLERP